MTMTAATMLKNKKNDDNSNKIVVVVIIIDFLFLGLTAEIRYMNNLQTRNEEVWKLT